MNKSASLNKKRFIAGAACPSCEKMDTIILIEKGSTKIFQCVSCQHEEQMTEPDKEAKNSAATERTDVIQWLKVDGE